LGETHPDLELLSSRVSSERKERMGHGAESVREISLTGLILEAHDLALHD